jgi:hypothetical protein
VFDVEDLNEEKEVIVKEFFRGRKYTFGRSRSDQGGCSILSSSALT